jgi:hypothetical protein
MRQMPHGQWVPFEGDEPHNCAQPADRSVSPPSGRPSRPRPVEDPVEPFTPFYPKVPESPAPVPLSNPPQPSPPRRPISTPQPRPARVISSPTAPAQTPRPISTPQPTPSSRGLPTHVDPAPAPRPTPPPSQFAPSHTPNRLSALFALITGLLGSTVGLLFAAFGLLSLPLSMVAVMHLTGWSWFSAIVGILVFSCIPIVGQLGYLVLATMGVYYLWIANFDWQQAVYTPAQTFSLSTLSESELERFKIDVVRRGFEKACRSESLKSSGFDGKLTTRAASQCECFATNFAAKLTRDDLIAYERSGRYPEGLEQRLGVELRRACAS